MTISTFISAAKEFVFTFFTLNLTSLNFFTTLFAILLAYYIFLQKRRWIVLLCANILFVYAISRKKSLMVMAVMLFSVWLVARLFEKFSGREKLKKSILVATLFFNAGLLVLLKDAIFFTNLLHISAGKAHVPILQRLAPIGISYWCLSSISYLLDCYWGTTSAERNFAKFAAVAGFFPLLVSGPIVRFGETASQIIEGNKFNYDGFCSGVQRIVWGVFKKLVIAERVAIYVNTVYGNFDAYKGLYVWLAFLLFVIQLYADFSGCIDIVLGTAELFGIKLPENFDLPFCSTSVSEFWRRWHITLGLWLKNYILYPILKTEIWQKIGAICKKIFSKRLAKKIPVWCALFVSWFLIGFWHGGYWNFIIGSGLYYWTIIVLGELFEPFLKKAILILRINTESFSWRLFQRMRTFIIFMMGSSLFRFREGFLTSRKMYKAAFTCWNPWIFFDGSIFRLGLDAKEFNVLIFALAILFAASYVKAKTGNSVRAEIAKQGVVFRWGLWIGLILFIVTFGMYGFGFNPQDFIYGGF